MSAAAWTIALALAAPAAPAELPPVSVDGESTATREQQTVADLLQVLDVFEREKAQYAPQAELRIRVLPRRDPGSQPALELRHGSVREAIALDALGRFTIPAAWRSCRPTPSCAAACWTAPWPGLWTCARQARRTTRGARVTCAWNAARTSTATHTLARGIKPPAFYALRTATNDCKSGQVTIGFFADRPVFAAQVREGDRHADLPHR